MRVCVCWEKNVRNFWLNNNRNPNGSRWQMLIIFFSLPSSSFRYLSLSHFEFSTEKKSFWQKKKFFFTCLLDDVHVWFFSFCSFFFFLVLKFFSFSPLLLLFQTNQNQKLINQTIAIFQYLVFFWFVFYYFFLSSSVVMGWKFSFFSGFKHDLPSFQTHTHSTRKIQKKVEKKR